MLDNLLEKATKGQLLLEHSLEPSAEDEERVGLYRPNGCIGLGLMTPSLPEDKFSRMPEIWSCELEKTVSETSRGACFNVQSVTAADDTGVKCSTRCKANQQPGARQTSNLLLNCGILHGGEKV